MNDQELLREFVRHKSQDAFRRLVERHTDWVYSVSLRRLRDPALAEDAVQAVFLALARKAPSLMRERTISPWLHSAARFVAANIVRGRARRRRYESEAAAMNATETSDTVRWNDIEAELEPAMDRLSSQDRQAILLRFYEQKSNMEMAATLRISELAAAKRLSRALERLRGILSRRSGEGTMLSAGGISALLLSHAVSPAPAALAASIGSGAAASASAATFAKGALVAMTTAQIKIAVAVVCVIALLPASFLIYRAYAAAPTGLFTVSVAAAPATAPTFISPVSPSDPVLRLNEALGANDATVFDSTHRRGTPTEEALTAGEGAVLNSQRKLLAIYGAKINATTPLSQDFIYLKRWPEEAVRGMTIRRSDDTHAVVMIPNILSYHVVLIEGKWFIQITESVGSRYPSDPDRAVRLVTRVLQDIAALYESTAEKINAGELFAQNDVIRVLSLGLQSIWQNPDYCWLLPEMPVPYTFSNAQFLIVPDSHGSLDEQVHRTAASGAAFRLESDNPKPESSVYKFTTLGAGSQTPANIELLRGKRVRLSAWVKTADVENWAGICFMVHGREKKCFAVDDNCAMPVTGNTEWKRLEFVADVPKDAAFFLIGPFVYGPGRLWVDGVRLEVVPDSVATTDDQLFHKWSAISPEYSAVMDPNVQHGGHPAICLSSDSAPRNQWCAYDHNDRFPEKYRGHRIRISAWIKSENVVRNSGFWIRVIHGANNEIVSKDDGKARHVIGTTEWTQYSTTAFVPEEADTICSGFVLYGPGKLWVDPDSITYELAD